MTYCNNMKNKTKYYNVGTAPISSRQNHKKRQNIYPTYKYTTASLTRYGTVTLIKRRGVNLVLLAQSHPLLAKCCGNASAYK